jgi:hypothetical protein
LSSSAAACCVRARVACAVAVGFVSSPWWWCMMSNYTCTCRHAGEPVERGQHGRCVAYVHRFRQRGGVLRAVVAACLWRVGGRGHCAEAWMRCTARHLTGTGASTGLHAYEEIPAPDRAAQGTGVEGAAPTDCDHGTYLSTYSSTRTRRTRRVRVPHTYHGTYSSTRYIAIRLVKPLTPVRRQEIYKFTVLVEYGWRRCRWWCGH